MGVSSVLIRFPNQILRNSHLECIEPSLLDTADEYDKFMADAMRLAKDVSGNQTFNTVKPLLNFWAAFSASNEVSCNAILTVACDNQISPLYEEWHRCGWNS